MKKYFRLGENYFEKRKTSDRVFLTLISFIMIYILFNFILFNPLENRALEKESQIASETEIKNTFEVKLQGLKSLPESPIFKDWTEQRRLYKEINEQYKRLQQTTHTQQWKEILEHVIQSQPHITIAEISSPPPAPFAVAQKNELTTPLYRQQLHMVIYGRYFDIVTYLQELEKALPAIRWDSLNYEVAEYPIAKVNLEFSLLYEKNNS